MFLNKRSKAIKQADKRQKTCNSTVMVVQIGEVFKVGIKSELKQLDKFVRKHYHLNRNEYFVWDYRNSIIYKAK